MAEIESCEVAEPVSTEEATHADRHGLLEHSREFLDFFWDIAKPQQETRLEATEKLLDYLRARPRVWWRGLAQRAAEVPARKLPRTLRFGTGTCGRDPGTKEGEGRTL